MNSAKLIGDDDRVAAAKEERGLMVGPWETDRCQHGKLYSFRWYWAKGTSPEDGDAEIGKRGCKACSKE